MVLLDASAIKPAVSNKRYHWNTEMRQQSAAPTANVPHIQRTKKDSAAYAGEREGILRRNSRSCTAHSRAGLTSSEPIETCLAIWPLRVLISAASRRLRTVMVCKSTTKPLSQMLVQQHPVLWCKCHYNRVCDGHCELTSHKTAASNIQGLGAAS